MFISKCGSRLNPFSSTTRRSRNTTTSEYRAAVCYARCLLSVEYGTARENYWAVQDLSKTTAAPLVDEGCELPTSWFVLSDRALSDVSFAYMKSQPKRMDIEAAKEDLKTRTLAQMG